MKLAVTDSSGVAKCMVCSWTWRVPTKRKKRGQQDRVLSSEERLKILEQNILAHLRDAHDRLMLTKEVIPSVEEGLPRVCYSGQRVGRKKWEKLW